MSGEWLLVIDMQRVFAEPSSPWYVPGFAAIVPAIDGLIASYGERTILTRYIPPDRLVGAWRDYYRRFDALLLPHADPAWDLVIGHPEASRVETRATFAKWDAAMRRIVGAEGCIALCGVATECCVLATALRAVDDGVPTRIFGRACAGATGTLHQQALEVLATFSPLITVV